MELKTMQLADIHPYPNNPRKNDDAVSAVVESIRQCGYVAPIIVDENNVILAGHTRYKALQSMGGGQIQVIVRKGLTEEQKRKYRLLDNKTNELAEWDFDLLGEELEGLDFGGFDFGFDALGSSFIDDLMEDSFVDHSGDSDSFAVSFVFKKEYEGDVLRYIKDNGKDKLVQIILEEVKLNA